MLVSTEEVEEIIQTYELKNDIPYFVTNFKASEHIIVSYQKKTSKFLMKTISKDSHVSEVLLPTSVPQSSSLVLNPGMYVACVYEGECFIGAIIGVWTCSKISDTIVNYDTIITLFTSVT